MLVVFEVYLVCVVGCPLGGACGVCGIFGVCCVASAGWCM